MWLEVFPVGSTVCMKTFPDYRYTVLSIVANRSFRGKFVYDLPENVVEVHELYLEDYDFRRTKSNKMRKIKMTDTEFEAMKSLLINQKVDWDTLFRFFGEKDFSLNDLLMGPNAYQSIMIHFSIVPHIKGKVNRKIA